MGARDTPAAAAGVTSLPGSSALASRGAHVAFRPSHPPHVPMLYWLQQYLTASAYVGLK